MDVYIGADHRGFELKQKVAAFLKSQGHNPIDKGTFTADEPCDYPQISQLVAEAVAKSAGSVGVLLCMTGIGHAIAANKVPGAYAALAYNKEAAVLSRQHNNANILVLGSKFVDESTAMGMISTWLSTPFEGGRHTRRVEQIKQIERNYLK